MHPVGRKDGLINLNMTVHLYKYLSCSRNFCGTYFKIEELYFDISIL